VGKSEGGKVGGLDIEGGGWAKGGMGEIGGREMGYLSHGRFLLAGTT